MKLLTPWQLERSRAMASKTRADTVLTEEKERLNIALVRAKQQRDELIAEVSRIEQEISDIDTALEKINPGRSGG